MKFEMLIVCKPNHRYYPLLKRAVLSNEATRILHACTETSMWDEGRRMAERLMAEAANADQSTVADLRAQWNVNDADYGFLDTGADVRDMLNFLIDRGEKARVFLAACGLEETE